jgi:hypothetical protein
MMAQISSTVRHKHLVRKHAWPPALPVRRCGGFCSGPREKERQNQGATADLEVHCAAWTSCSLLRWSSEEKEEESKRRKIRKGKEKKNRGKWII